MLQRRKPLSRTIERRKEPKREKVTDLMEALRQSAALGGKQEKPAKAGTAATKAGAAAAKKTTAAKTAPAKKTVTAKATGAKKTTAAKATTAKKAPAKKAAKR